MSTVLERANFVDGIGGVLLKAFLNSAGYRI